QVITNQNQLKKFKPGNIAVIKQLNSSFQGLIYKSSAIILEERIYNNQLLTKLRHFQVPCLINVAKATHSIRDQQPIIVDASAGKVYTIQPTKPTQKHSQPLDLLLAINDESELDQHSAQLTAGIGIIRSEHFLIKRGLHPERLIKTDAQAFIDHSSHQLVTLYHRYYSLAKQAPTLSYRSCNLDTNQLIKLEGGEIYEQIETNPYLGLRGAMRVLSKPNLFKLELKILEKANSQVDQPINLVLPFVRSVIELQQLNRLVESHFSSAVYRPPIWLQLNTPENLLCLEKYLSHPLSAICINLNSIHALLHGVDPSFADLYNQYPIDETLLEPYLDKALKLVKQKKPDLKVYFICFEYQQRLVDLAVSLGATGIIAQPNLVKEINQYLLNKSE
ncbi:MAG TPA: hypothetical protein PLM16_02880, partial [Candidatus Woesebacteria bacterium]|nr:hypothetical protein [Candidatus Woesebacteria bacterium]